MVGGFQGGITGRGKITKLREEILRRKVLVNLTSSFRWRMEATISLRKGGISKADFTRGSMWQNVSEVKEEVS